MDGGGAGPSLSQQSHTSESLSALSDGLWLVLSRWTALQMAVQNEWGGRDSRQKLDQLFSDVVSYFRDSKDPYYIDDLEDILEKTMLLSFNTEVEDGSVEEVAEEMMTLHEECLQGHYDSIEKLRKLSGGAQAVSQSRQVVNENEDESESSDEESSEMAVDEPNQKQPVVADDGWSVVTSRRNRAKPIFCACGTSFSGSHFIPHLKWALERMPAALVRDAFLPNAHEKQYLVFVEREAPSSASAVIVI
ncbi:hypothetical protein ACLOJK_005801 [Asimina triloba]